ncbi:MAG: 50S ribosomal protein L29 [Chloroflexi bacterium]|nr:50S ribosomal protein L29 [Chloroflexota bacterium]MCL5109930.1 50S ribosomal protein L29 [Chloroflexota bacterium]
MRKKYEELRELNPDELRRRLLDSKQELFNLRFQLATRSLTNYSRMNEVRRNIARINTLLRERELGIR